MWKILSATQTQAQKHQSQSTPPLPQGDKKRIKEGKVSIIPLKPLTESFHFGKELSKDAFAEDEGGKRKAKENTSKVPWARGWGAWLTNLKL